MADFDEEKQNKQLADLHKQEEEELVATLAESKYKLPYIDLARLGIDNEALRAISEQDARELKVAPFKLFGKNIFVAVRSPSDDLLAKLKDRYVFSSLITTFFLSIPVLTYYGIGVWQYGYRYALDFYPFLFLILLSVFKDGLPLKAKVLIIYSILFNLLFMYSIWYKYPFGLGAL